MKIEKFESSRAWMYLWLKAIKGFNLDNHCARALTGPYEPRDNMAAGVELKDSKVYYLCGVSKPYRWDENFHLAFQHKPGHILHINEKGLEVVIRDAEQIIFPALSKGEATHPKGDQREFYTCRNWQFAYQMLSEEQPGPFLF